MYIGTMKNFTLRYCYTHHAKIGHEIKSRAQNNYILYNRISNETTGTASRNIDLPNGGLAIIIGNLIEQGPGSDNANLIGYGLEGLSNPAPQSLYLVNNTIINDRSSGSFIHLQPGTGVLKLINNIFGGPGTLINGTATAVDSATNFISVAVSAIGFVNVASYDYQLVSSAKVIGKGSNPGTAGSYLLIPVSEYLHNSNKRNRATNGTIDIGAYEYVMPTAIDHSVAPVLELNAFPNPFSSTLTLSITCENSGILTIVNALGAVIFNEKIEQGTKEAEVCMENYPAGFYAVSFRTDNGSIYKKLIKV
jgi:hypothetical protein